ncbi:hypothetical protein [Amycolatopsis methanolica]|uniref:hypothetical protein n=1 Tax=Amycolatopsis methanolica TaxID=1814 RepID=UPI000366B799|nr:hypothetical protein [Amycolatopsis methanolica]
MRRTPPSSPPDGTVHAANGAARLLFPALRPGRTLANCVSAWPCAHAAGPAVAAGRVDDRTSEAHQVRQPEGPVMWWLETGGNPRSASASPGSSSGSISRVSGRGRSPRMHTTAE